MGHLRGKNVVCSLPWWFRELGLTIAKHAGNLKLLSTYVHSVHDVTSVRDVYILTLSPTGLVAKRSRRCRSLKVLEGSRDFVMDVVGRLKNGRRLRT